MIFINFISATILTIMDRDFLPAFIFVTCVKVLLMPMYHSTDMEVHRNWKAITHSFNFKEWYFEDTSPWTLDYPPLFAWFECVLSFFAKFFDKNLLNIANLNHKSPETLFFMRMSVIFSDFIYVIAVGRIYNILKKNTNIGSDPWFKPEVIFAMLMLWNPGLLLVDHIHFQYNGFLNGILFLSIAAIMEDKYLESAFWYSVLLNFKHLYVYFAPAYFVYLLKNYCFNQRGSRTKLMWENFSIKRFLSLGAVVGVVFTFSFGPFIALGQFSQVLKRIFPVKRGLTHAYWAPNFWALYNFLDRILVTLIRAIFGSKHYASSSVTKGLVQEYHHAILPSISILITVILTLLSVAPFMWIVWKKPKSISLFIHSIVGCAFGSFLFGYHVHEKAILMVTLPLTLLVLYHQEFVFIFVIVSAAGHFALFPLLYEAGETPIKIVILVLHVTYSYTSLCHLHQQQYEPNVTNNSYSTLEWLLLCGLPMIQLLNAFGLTFLKLDMKYQFLSLMMVSVYCALCILYCWVKYCKLVFNLKTRLL